MAKLWAERSEGAIVVNPVIIIQIDYRQFLEKVASDDSSLETYISIDILFVLSYTILMHYFPEESAIVGVSELRTHLKEILELAKKVKIFLGRRQKPVAVLLPIEKYREMEVFLDRIEDAVLGYIAKERGKSTPEKQYLTLEEAEKKVGLKK